MDLIVKQNLIKCKKNISSARESCFDLCKEINPAKMSKLI